MISKLTGKNREEVIDLLMERLIFERSGVSLYDTILRKMEASSDPEIAKMIDQMREHREEEKEHEEWLEDQVRAIGADDKAMTPRAMLVKTESEGIVRVVEQESMVQNLFHALLVAELADNAGWDLLVQVADEAGDRQAKREFKKRLHEEEEHLLFVRRALERFALREVLRQDVSMPTAP